MSSNSLMSVLCVNVCRLCMPNIMSLGISFKKLHRVKVGAFLLDIASKFTLFSLSGFKDEKLIKEQTCVKTETCKLYSGVFWIFLPNVIEIDPYNFELYRFKVDAFFWDTVGISAKAVRIYTTPRGDWKRRVENATVEISAAFCRGGKCGT